MTYQPVSKLAFDLLLDSRPHVRPARLPSGPVARCPDCKGRGQVTTDFHMLHQDPTVDVCWTCDGSGEVKVLGDWVSPMLRELGL